MTSLWLVTRPEVMTGKPELGAQTNSDFSTGLCHEDTVRFILRSLFAKWSDRQHSIRDKNTEKRTITQRAPKQSNIIVDNLE